jgi:MOSC domain-containing protein YiiM
MISLDPDTAEANPDILRQVVQAHGSSAGVYGAMLAEGLVRTGDPVTLLD